MRVKFVEVSVYPAILSIFIHIRGGVCLCSLFHSERHGYRDTSYKDAEIGGTQKRTLPLNTRSGGRGKKTKIKLPSIAIDITSRAYLKKHEKKIINSESFKTEFVFKSVLFKQPH